MRAQNVRDGEQFNNELKTNTAVLLTMRLQGEYWNSSTVALESTRSHYFSLTKLASQVVPLLRTPRSGTREGSSVD